MARRQKGVGQSGRLCWETEEHGMTWSEAKQASEETRGSFRLTFDEEEESWSLEVKKPCGPAHPMRRFMYTGMQGRRKR
jgi:hypothetical protein